MRVKDFVPTHYTVLMGLYTLRIQIVYENGECVVYKALYNDENEKVSKSITKSFVREDSRGHSYFCHRKQRYYIGEFMPIHYSLPTNTNSGQT